jgi:CheY-like chemotaxis protein
MPIALIADNDAGVRGLLAELARRQGFEVRVAADGLAAQEALAAGDVDLLVCDLDMPRLSGQQLVAGLADSLRVPLVVVVSGYVDAAIQASLMAQRGVRVVLRKPFDVMAFAGLLRGYASELIAKSRQEEAAGSESGAPTRVEDPLRSPVPQSMPEPSMGRPASVSVGLEADPAGKNHFVP